MHPTNGWIGRLPEVGKNIDSRQSAWNFFYAVKLKCQAHWVKVMINKTKRFIFFISHAESARHFSVFQKSEQMIRKFFSLWYNKINMREAYALAQSGV